MVGRPTAVRKPLRVANAGIAVGSSKCWTRAVV